MARRRHLDPEFIAEVVRRYEAGERIGEICLHCHIDNSTLRICLMRAGRHHEIRG
jgi:hypothetical protein